MTFDGMMDTQICTSWGSRKERAAYHLSMQMPLVELEGDDVVSVVLPGSRQSSCCGDEEEIPRKEEAESASTVGEVGALCLGARNLKPKVGLQSNRRRR